MVKENHQRQSNMFEKLLLIVGTFVFVGGIVLIIRAGEIAKTYSDPTVIVAALMWLLLILIMVIAAIAENAREGISRIVSETASEIKLLRQISQEQMEEIKLLRQANELNSKKKK